MKIGRAASHKQGGLVRVCAVFSPLFSPGFSCTPLKTALILPPESLPSDVFLVRHPLPGHRDAPGAHLNAPSCRNTRLYGRPGASLFLSANRRPTVLLRRFDFGEFCIVSHETSAFSMFSTCLILLCFCPILIAFWRDLERKTLFLPALPSRDRSPTFVLARRRRRKPRQGGATLAPQQTDAQPRKTSKKNARAGEGMGEQPERDRPA